MKYHGMVWSCKYRVWKGSRGPGKSGNMTGKVGRHQNIKSLYANSLYLLLGKPLKNV